MRHKTYLTKHLNTGIVEELPWDRNHFQKVGLSSDLSAMPILEAHQLVNNWNLNQDPQTRVYALKEM